MLNPDLQKLQPYPFERLTRLFSGVTPPSDQEPIHLAIGEPQHPSPEIVLETLRSNMHLISKYPTTKGSEELRVSISDWLVNRFKLGQESVCPDHHVIPVVCNHEELSAFLVIGRIVRSLSRPCPRTSRVPGVWMTDG